MIENLKDLKHLLKLCRENGVTDINWGKGSLKLGEAPKQQTHNEIEDQEDNSFADALEAPMSPEELVQFSNGTM